MRSRREHLLRLDCFSFNETATTVIYTLSLNDAPPVFVGQSGSGKSTLLSLMAGLDRQTAGSLRLRDKEISEMSEVKLTQFRAENIGIIFQQFYLMPHLTALENVSLPLEMFGYEDRSEEHTSELQSQ